jgi:signal transduction histidine kinase
MARPHQQPITDSDSPLPQPYIDYFLKAARITDPGRLARFTLTRVLPALDALAGGIWLRLPRGRRGRITRGLPPEFRTADWRSWLPKPAPVPRYIPLSGAAGALTDTSLRALRAQPELSAAAGVVLLPLSLSGRQLGVFMAVIPARLQPPQEAFAGTALTFMLASIRRLALIGRRNGPDRSPAAMDPGRGSFFSIITHELKTPLNSIIGYTDLLLSEREEDFSDQAMDYLRQIRISAQQQLRMIQNVLSLTSLDAGLVKVVATCVSVHRLVRQLVERNEQKFPERIRRIHYEMDPATEHLFVDGRLLRQMLAHLIDNAFKFSPEGGEIVIRSHLESAALGERPYLYWSIRNQGQGIPARYRNMLFQPFFQMDQSLTRAHDGVGLGLYQCRRICELLGGTIDYESHSENGTTFTVKIPVEPDAATAAGTGGGSDA